MPTLAGTETWIFDLDNTLYPPSAGLLAEIDARIEAFIARELRVGPAEAHRVRVEGWRRHGITVNALAEDHGVDPHAFLAEVHAVDLSGLAPDPALGAALARLPGRCVVHTNSARVHAQGVLDALGIAEAFEAVFAIEDKGFAAKPTRAAFAHVLEGTGADPRRAVMVEDTPGNLVEPRRLGMTTVWLAEGAAGSPTHVDHRIDDLRAFLEAAV